MARELEHRWDAALRAAYLDGDGSRAEYIMRDLQYERAVHAAGIPHHHLAHLGQQRPYAIVLCRQRLVQGHQGRTRCIHSTPPLMAVLSDVGFDQGHLRRHDLDPLGQLFDAIESRGTIGFVSQSFDQCRGKFDGQCRFERNHAHAGLQVFSRHLEFPDGTFLALPDKPVARKTASKARQARRSRRH